MSEAPADGYRVAASRARRATRFDATVRAFAAGWISVRVIAVALVILPLVFFPTRVEVECSASAATCTVVADRVAFGRWSQTIDMQGATDAAVRQGKQPVIVIARGADPPRTYRCDPIGIGSEGCLTLGLREFIAHPETAYPESHDGRHALDVALLVWAALVAVTFLATVSHLRVEAESDGVHLSMRVSQFPYGSRSLKVPLAEVKGVRAVPIPKRLFNGRTVFLHVDIVLDMVERSESLFLHRVIMHPKNTAFAASLGGFVAREVGSIA